LLCISYEYPPVGGGGASAARGLAEALVSSGYQIDCVTTGMRGLPRYEVTGGVNVHRINCVRIHRHYTGAFELMTQVYPSYKKGLELIRQNRYDLNHTHFIIPSGLTSYLLWKKTGTPYVITAHGSDVPHYNPDRFHFAHHLAHPLWRKIIAHSELIISPSVFLKEMIGRFTDKQVEVIPNGDNLVTINQGAGKKNQILVVARMFERKGVQYFLEAIQNLDTDWEILIAGDGPYLDVLKNIAGTIKPAVQFTGFIDRERLARLYASAKIFVFPSIQENFPIVLLEAMNAGCAIITTSAEGCAEVVGDTGIVAEPRNVKQIRQALDKLMRDPVAIEEMSGKARLRVLSFSWSNIAERYDHVFQAVLNK
jgi:glycosyltransferase involved in cell wall biosynthesis